MNIPRSRKFWIFTITILCVIAIGGTGLYLAVQSGTSSPATAASSTPRALSCKFVQTPTTAGHYVGIITKPPTAPAPFKANIAEFYEGFGTHFPGKVATRYRAEGMLPFLQINPRKISLADIVAGKYDAYLKKFGLAARRFCTPLVFSFGHEMNGRWYTWSRPQTKPATFVAAWRHIHKVFTNQVHAKNIIWAWDPDHGGYPSRAWWPGKSYVNWIGIDGYFRKTERNFNTVFKARIDEVRKFTKDPIIIAETGAPVGRSQVLQINNLFRGVAQFKLMGLIWFDIPAMENYRIDHVASAIAAIRRHI